MIHPTVSIRLSAIKEMGIKYGIDFIKLLPESERLTVDGLAEDYYMFGQLGVFGKCLNIDEVLIKYRWHGDNVGAKKFVDQITLSIKISRYLAALFCAKNGLERFDPAPFCTYGGTVLSITDDTSTFNLAKSFAQISDKLTKVIGSSVGLSRELAYRKVLTTRNTFYILVKYGVFILNNKSDIDEWYAVKNWATRKIKPRQLIPVSLR